MKLECLYAPHKWRENETWFNECADEGLFLEHWGATHITFADYHSFGFQYWIDVDNGGSTPNGHRQNQLERLGYEYVTTAPTGWFHVYRAPKGTPDMPANMKLRKQAGILYNFSNWFILPFYTLLFLIHVIDSIRTLTTPELLAQVNPISVISFLILSSGMVLYNLRELSQKVKLFLDLSKPVTHERIPLKKPSTKYGLIEKYAKYQFIILLAMYILLLSR